MDQEPLVSDEIEAGAEFVKRLDKVMPVTAAFWLKEDDEGLWYLYVASDRVDDTNLRQSYGEALRVADQAPSPYLDPFRIKLISMNHTLAQAALEINHQFPGRIPTRFGGTKFGGMAVAGVYLYPPAVTASTSCCQ
jgi:hypothetical protein